MISASTASRLISPRPRKVQAAAAAPAAVEEEEEEERRPKGEELRFVCQRCRKAVLLGESFADVDEAALDAALAGGALDEGQFVELQRRPRAGARAGGGGRAAALRRLFERAGAGGGLVPADHPLCAECASLLLAELSRRTQEEAQEAARYEAFLEGLARERSAAADEEAALLRQTEALEADAAALAALLQRLQAQRMQVHHAGARLQLQARQADLLEERYWRTCNRLQLQVRQYEEEKAAVLRHTRYAQEQLQALQRTNVYNDTFHIWHDGHFATVNGLRLGSLPSMQVEWPEINAAWGHAALLLHTLACKVGFRFSAFRVLPLGSQSRMERLSDRATFELYGSREITFGKLFWFKRFDTAMVAFLQCVDELCQHLRHLDAAFQQPYRCERDRLGPDHAHMLSVKKQFNSDEEWTKAMKYLLTNLKAILQWLSNR